MLSAADGVKTCLQLHVGFIVVNYWLGVWTHFLRFLTKVVGVVIRGECPLKNVTQTGNCVDFPDWGTREISVDKISKKDDNDDNSIGKSRVSTSDVDDDEDNEDDDDDDDEDNDSNNSNDKQ